MTTPTPPERSAPALTMREIRQTLGHNVDPTPTPTPDAGLRQRIETALRDAAYLCDGACGHTEVACVAAHPIQADVLTHGVVSDIAGPIADIAAVVLPLVAAERAAALRGAALDLESQYPDVGIGSRETLRVARWLRARAGAEDGQP